jgi:hypothetical protein
MIIEGKPARFLGCDELGPGFNGVGGKAASPSSLGLTGVQRISSYNGCVNGIVFARTKGAYYNDAHR